MANTAAVLRMCNFKDEEECMRVRQLWNAPCIGLQLVTIAGARIFVVIGGSACFGASCPDGHKPWSHGRLDGDGEQPIVSHFAAFWLRTSAEEGNFEEGGLWLVPGASWADSMIFTRRFRPE